MQYYLVLSPLVAHHSSVTMMFPKGPVLWDCYQVRFMNHVIKSQLHSQKSALGEIVCQ